MGLGKYNVRMLSLLGSTVYTQEKTGQHCSQTYLEPELLSQPSKGPYKHCACRGLREQTPYYLQSNDEETDEVDEWTVVTQDYNDLVPPYDWLSLVKKFGINLESTH